MFVDLTSPFTFSSGHFVMCASAFPAQCGRSTPGWGTATKLFIELAIGGWERNRRGKGGKGSGLAADRERPVDTLEGCGTIGWTVINNSIHLNLNVHHDLVCNVCWVLGTSRTHEPRRLFGRLCPIALDPNPKRIGFRAPNRDMFGACLCNCTSS